MGYKDILLGRDGQVAVITLNRPDHLNAFTMNMGAELLAALREVDDDPGLRVSVVTGAGRAFCAGVDMSGEEQSIPPSGAQAETVRTCFALRKPVIVAFNGAAVGVGVTMTLPFDIRIAGESARLGMVFVRRGLIPELASPWLLPRIIGISRAAELLYTGRMLTAAEALEFGLVSRVVPDEQLMPAALDLAREIADNCSPVCVTLTKRMLYDFLAETDAGKVEAVNERYLQWVMTQPDAVEGITAYLQKRAPEWPMKVPGDLPEVIG